MKTQTEIRDAFWGAHPEYRPLFRKGKRQNDYDTDIRCAFVDFVDQLRREEVITEKLAMRVTL